MKADPAQKYYDAIVAGAPDFVEAAATARPGYFFVRWIGEGDYWTKDPFGTMHSGTGSLSAADDAPASWVTDSKIYVQVEGTIGTRKLTAVFHPCVHCGTVHEGRLRGSTPLDAGDGYTLGGEGNYYTCWHHVIRKLQRIGAAWNAAYPDRNFTIQRISPLECVDPGEGTSHHNGLDVDVWYVQTPGTGRVYLNPAPYTTPRIMTKSHPKL